MNALRNIAVVGYAQAPTVARDEHRTAQEMLYPQVRRVLEECGVERDDVDFQVAGSADYIDGRPFGFVASLDVTGSWPPRADSHLEMDASFAAYYAWLRIQAGDCDTALVVGYGKASEGEPEHVLNLQLDPFFQAPIGLDPVSTAALQASAYLERSGLGDRDLAEVAALARRAGARNPDAQIRETAGAGELQETPWKVRPLRTGYLPPVGESAVALILAAEGRAEKMCARPAWIHGVDQRVELQTLGARDLACSAGAKLAGERALAMAGMSRADEADVVELLATNPAEELILCEALGLDRRARGSGPAINPSGGPLVAHPLMMTGLIRLGEAFRQLAGTAGEHQVDAARRAIAHGAQGHALQHNIVWVLGGERRWA